MRLGKMNFGEILFDEMRGHCKCPANMNFLFDRTSDLKDIIVSLICEILDYNIVDKTIEVKETLLPVIKSGLNKFHGKI